MFVFMKGSGVQPELIDPNQFHLGFHKAPRRPPKQRVLLITVKTQ
jgi:hypothetical protein